MRYDRHESPDHRARCRYASARLMDGVTADELITRHESRVGSPGGPLLDRGPQHRAERGTRNGTRC